MHTQLLLLSLVWCRGCALQLLAQRVAYATHWLPCCFGLRPLVPWVRSPYGVAGHKTVAGLIALRAELHSGAGSAVACTALHAVPAPGSKTG